MHVAWQSVLYGLYSTEPEVHSPEGEHCISYMACNCPAIERLHVTSQSRENHTGGHFGAQLDGDLVCCTMRLQNAVQT